MQNLGFRSKVEWNWLHLIKSWLTYQESKQNKCYGERLPLDSACIKILFSYWKNSLLKGLWSVETSSGFIQEQHTSNAFSESSGFIQEQHTSNAFSES